MSYQEQLGNSRKQKSIIGQTIQESMKNQTSPPQGEKEDSQYEAFKKTRETKSETMLEINRQGERSLLIYYFDIKEIEFTGNRLLTIATSQKIITIEGKHLLSVKDLFRKNRVLSVNEFDPMKYVSAGGKGEAFIQGIEVVDVSGREGQ